MSASNIDHRDALTGQALAGAATIPNHTVMHVSTASGDEMAAAFRRALLTAGRAAAVPFSQAG
ncbi:hypothetical protein [Sinomonas soli]